MIKEAFRCPACDIPVAIDCISGDVVFDPDGLSGLPCTHLSCFWICLSFDGSKKFVERYTRSWLGVFGRGISKINAEADLQEVALTRYIMDCGFGRLAPELLPSDRTFAFVGRSAAEREEEQPGTGEFLVFIRGKFRSAILDGWGLFSQKPQELMEEINELSFEYEV